MGRGHVVQPISLSLPAAGASATADRGRASLTGYIRLLCFVLKLLDRLQRRQQHRFGGWVWSSFRSTAAAGSSCARPRWAARASTNALLGAKSMHHA